MNRKMNEKIMHIRNKGKANLNHFTKGTFAKLNTAIRIPEVGIIMFEKPSPQVKAKTAVCRVMPSKSAKGAISGIVTAAWPEPDGIKNFNVL